MDLETRFTRYIDGKEDPDGCWKWNGALDPNDYGLFTHEKKTYKAHRFSWMMYYGEELDSKELLLNRCGTYACINPRHWIKNTIENRFWEKVNKSGPTMPHMETNCWVWTAGSDRSGYGHFTWVGKTRKAYVASYVLNKGEIPPGMCVCHACDNPACVRPDHLWLGTHKENSQDMVAKGRARGGAKKPLQGMEKEKQAKLTDHDVREIRRIYDKKTCNQYDLAQRYGVTQSLISGVLNGKRWAHLTAPN